MISINVIPVNIINHQNLYYLSMHPQLHGNKNCSTKWTMETTGLALVKHSLNLAIFKHRVWRYVSSLEIKALLFMLCHRCIYQFPPNEVLSLCLSYFLFLLWILLPFCTSGVDEVLFAKEVWWLHDILRTKRMILCGISFEGYIYWNTYLKLFRKYRKYQLLCIHC